MVFSNEIFLEATIENWLDWNLNPWLLGTQQVGLLEAAIESWLEGNLNL